MVSARTIAVLLVVIGAAAFALPTFATEGFNTERPTSFSIGSEDDSLIGAEETDETVMHPRRGSRTATAGRLINNFDSELSLSYRVRSDDPSVEGDPQRDTVRLQPGQKADITVRCASGNSGTGTAVVTAVVESAQADGVGIEDAEFDFQVRYDCVPPTPEGGDGGDGGDGGAGDGGDGGAGDGGDGGDGGEGGGPPEDPGN